MIEEERTIEEQDQDEQITDMFDTMADTEVENTSDDTQEKEDQVEEIKADDNTESSDKDVDSVSASESEDEEVIEEISASDSKDKEQEVVKEVVKDKKEEVKEASVEESLRGELNKMAQKAMAAPIDVNPPAKSEEVIRSETVADPQLKKAQVVRDLIPFVTSDDDYEKAMSDPKEMNALMNKVYDSAITYMTQSVPQLVGHMVTQQTSMRNLVDDFYKTNEDLVPMKSYVGFVANELAAKNPSWEYDQLFGEVAKEVRKRVNISGKASSVETQASTQRPAFAKKPSGRQNIGVKLSELETDMADLM
tara:strand:- start:7070 stop:7990 length:921 start_codon:yes stop_codon:yes gene_type:complete